jgi:hypothetical protein
MIDRSEIQALLRRFENEQAEAYEAEIDADREEELKIWFLAREAKKRLGELRMKREEREASAAKHSLLSEPPRQTLTLVITLWLRDRGAERLRGLPPDSCD